MFSSDNYEPVLAAVGSVSGSLISEIKYVMEDRPFSPVVYMVSLVLFPQSIVLAAVRYVMMQKKVLCAANFTNIYNASEL